MNNHRDVEAEATRRAPVNEKFTARDANAHYRIGFREGAEWAARDAIIIPRTDLPEVDTRDDVLIAELDVEERGAAVQAILGTGRPNADPDWHRAKANAYLALAEHLEKHPPIKVTTDEVDSILEQVATDREGSTYWNGRQQDLDAVEAYLGSLRDHLTAGDLK